MSKLVIRLTVLLVATYLVLCYIVTAIFDVDIWCQAYYLLFELCVCLCISKQGVYHCKYVKWTAYAILIEDCVATGDVFFDYIPDNMIAFVSPTILTAGLATSATLAIRHYIRVKRLKRHVREISDN